MSLSMQIEVIEDPVTSFSGLVTLSKLSLTGKFLVYAKANYDPISRGRHPALVFNTCLNEIFGSGAFGGADLISSANKEGEQHYTACVGELAAAGMLSEDLVATGKFEEVLGPVKYEDIPGLRP